MSPARKKSFPPLPGLLSTRKPTRFRFYPPPTHTLKTTSNSNHGLRIVWWEQWDSKRLHARLPCLSPQFLRRVHVLPLHPVLRSSLRSSIPIPPLLTQLAAERYVVYGVVSEICVRHAALGLLQQTSARVELVTDAIRHLNPGAYESMLTEFKERGGVLTTSPRF